MKPVSPTAKDVSMKALALVLAIAIWAVAISEKQRATPSPKIELVVQAPVTLKNASDGLVVTESPTAVTVRLKGPKELESTALESTVVVVDLKEAEPGQNLFPIEVISPEGFELVRASRAMVGLTLERRSVSLRQVEVALVTAPQFSLELEHDVSAELGSSSVTKTHDDTYPSGRSLSGGAAETGLEGVQEGTGLLTGGAFGHHEEHAYEEELDMNDQSDLVPSISVSPAEVSIEGADSAVAEVARAVAVVTVGQESTVVAPILALDIHGEPVSDVAVYPETVTVSIPLQMMQ